LCLKKNNKREYKTPKNMELPLELKRGIGRIHFGMTIEEVEKFMGKASDIEQIDGTETKFTSILRYTDEGITLFFEGESCLLVYIDISNEDCTLWGEKIFFLQEVEIEDLMKKKGYKNFEKEEEDWGEKRITFHQGNIDFFYENGELISIFFGA